MIKHKLAVLIVFLNIAVILSGSIIRENLRYLQTDKDIWRLSETDFRDDIRSSLRLVLDEEKLIVLFEFSRTVDTNHIIATINSFPYEDVTGHLQIIGRGYGLDITDYVMLGTNTVTISYDKPGEHDMREWRFDVIKKNLFNLEQPVPITQTKGHKKNMTVSPDGRLVAYLLEDLNQTSIMILNLDSTKEYEVITSRIDRTRRPDREEKFYSYAPCWSRDGHYLFFISTKDGYPQIYRVYVNYEGSVDSKSMVQLTDSNEYITNLLYSPFEEKLYFSKIHNGWLRLFTVDNPVRYMSPGEFSRAMKLITREERHEYTPDISFDGRYLAFCYEERETDSKIQILDRENMSIVDVISITDRDALYPSWSPVRNMLAFFSENNLFVYDMDRRGSPVRVATDRRPTTYIQKPVWDVDGENIHFIKNDVNFSLNRCIIDFNNLQRSRTVAYLDSSAHRDNREIAVTPNKERILYISTQEGTFNLWTMKRKGIQKQALLSFDTPYNTTLSWINPFRRERELIGFSPLLYHPSASYELENVNVGPQSVLVEGTREVITTNADVPAFLRFQKEQEDTQRFSRALYYSIVPGWGQRKNYDYAKSRFFFRTFLGLALLGAGVYYLEEDSYDKYNEALTVDDIDKYRTETVTFEGYRRGIITTASLLYVLNILDAAFSKPRIRPERYDAFEDAFLQRRAMNRRVRPIYGKELSGHAELKVITNQPGVELYLQDRYRDEVYYGKINYDFHKDVHFTITGIDPGRYTLTGKHDRFGTMETELELEPYLVHYTALEFEKRKRGGFRGFLNASIPSYYHFNNNQPIKGAAILGLSALALTGALISDMQATSNYNDYNDFADPHNISKLREYKDNYHRNISYRNTYLSLFAVIYIYNMIDSLGE